MMEYNVYFSPTGGTEKAAMMLSPEGKVIDLSGTECPSVTVFGKDDLVFVSVPSFQGRVPEFVTERIRASLSGNGTPCVLNACWGARAFDDTLIELHDTMTALGFVTVAAVSSITEHSMIREFAAGRPDEDDGKDLSSFRDRILGKLSSGDFSTPAIPGNRPYRATHPNMQPLFRADACTYCRACASSCPAGAISMLDPGKTDPEKCISCMRCIAVCTAGARYIDPVKLGAVKEKIGPACAIPKKAELFI